MVFTETCRPKHGDTRADEMQATKTDHEIFGHAPEQLQITQAAVGSAEQCTVFKLTAKVFIRTDFCRRDVGDGSACHGGTGFGFPVEEWGSRHGCDA